ncbi:MAG: DUF1223 domain-containing protein [Proteobacteria bacterium]|nr:DUF1223 domain-containing protein [Pseudomonadota bacterium]
MKHFLKLITFLVITGCAVEEHLVESRLAEVESQTVNGSELKVESTIVNEEEIPIQGYQRPVPDISIHEAAAQGRIEIVKQHLAIHPEGYINTRTPSGWTPLHFAYEQGRAKMSRFLLDKGADYEAKNKLAQAPADIRLLKRNLKNSQFALVELYTSESCSSCPPAERLTAEIRRMALAKRVNIFCVSFHVDYFDSESWSDSFSDERFSARQRAYEYKRFSGLYYTPQIIVNGKYQTLGYNRANTFNAINRSLKVPSKAAVSVRQVRKGAEVIAVNVCTLGKFKNAKLCVALVQHGIKRRITGGENKGRTLSMDNVVQEFKCVEITGPVGHEFTFDLKQATGGKRYSLNAVAFVQRTDNMEMLGAQAVRIQRQPDEKSNGYQW